MHNGVKFQIFIRSFRFSSRLRLKSCGCSLIYSLGISLQSGTAPGGKQHVSLRFEYLGWSSFLFNSIFEIILVFLWVSLNLWISGRKPPGFILVIYYFFAVSAWSAYPL